jgi:hypothetical protein
MYVGCHLQSILNAKLLVSLLTTLCNMQLAISGTVKEYFICVRLREFYSILMLHVCIIDVLFANK